MKTYVVRLGSGAEILRTCYLDSARSIAATIGGAVYCANDNHYTRIW